MQLFCSQQPLRLFVVISGAGGEKNDFWGWCYGINMLKIRNIISVRPIFSVCDANLIREIMLHYKDVTK